MYNENKNPNLDEEGLEDDYSDDDGGSRKEGDDTVNVAKSKIVLMKKLFDNIRNNSEQLAQLMAGFVTKEDEERISISQIADESFKKEGEEEEGKIVEGVFDGESMIGPDGKKYSVPANYASKSKLVEGDIMKLTITPSGTFIYKQIGPIERARVIGQLEKESDGSYYVAADGKRWRVLPASITYFKGQPGDEVVILVPKSGESRWAAVENIIRTQV